MAVETISPGATATTHPELAEAIAWCKDYTKARAKNFYYAFAILPREEARRHLCGVCV